MANTTDDYSKLLDGRLPTSSLEFELCDRLIELEKRLEAGQHEPIVMWQPIEKARYDTGWYLVKEKDDDMHIAIWDEEEQIWTNGYFEVKPVKFIELGVLAKLPDAA